MEQQPELCNTSSSGQTSKTNNTQIQQQSTYRYMYKWLLKQLLEKTCKMFDQTIAWSIAWATALITKQSIDKSMRQLVWTIDQYIIYLNKYQWLSIMVSSLIVTDCLTAWCMLSICQCCMVHHINVIHKSVGRNNINYFLSSSIFLERIFVVRLIF